MRKHLVALTTTPPNKRDSGVQKARLLVVTLATVASLLGITPAATAKTDWSGNYPTAGDVTIPAGETVVLDTDLNVTGLIIEGTVECGTTNARIKARWILIKGTFRCGTHDSPFKGKLTITLRGSGNGNFNGFGDKYIVVANGGRLELHGKRQKSWTRLATTAHIGATTITLDREVWKPGAELVIAPTNYEMDQAEVVTIASRNKNVVTLTQPLQWEHYCGTDTYAGKSITECAEVGLLSHSIVIRGNTPSATTQIGGHLMAHAGSIVKIEDTEFFRMGQLGRLGRYPIHFHHTGHNPASYVRRTSVHHAYNRWVTIHDTHDLLIKQVVGFDTVGHGFYLEDGIETKNRLIGNLGILVRGASQDQALTPSDTQAATFWISNPDNTVNRNVAAGADFAGFWLSFSEHGVGSSSDPDEWPRRTPLKSFRNNTAHTTGFAGLYMDGGEDENRNVTSTWFEPRQNPADGNSPHVTPEIWKFTSYKNRHYGFWIQTLSGINIVKAALADNWRSYYIANLKSGPSYDNVGLVTDSLLVGTSSNKGVPEGWETTDENGHTLPKPWDPDTPLGGVPYYRGPMRIENSVLAKFLPNATRDAGALTSLSPNPYPVSTHNEAANLRFVQSKRVLFPDLGEGRQGDGGTIFHDVDGSVTGIPGNEVVVNLSLLDDITCTTKAFWNASLCAHDGYVRIKVGRNDGEDIGADVTREDGRTLFLRGTGNPSSTMSINLIADIQHVLDFREGTPDQYTFWSSEFNGDGAVRIAVPEPPGNWTVTIWGVSNSEVESLAALNSGPGGWFYDSETGLIHLRFTEATGRGGVIES